MYDDQAKISGRLYRDAGKSLSKKRPFNIVFRQIQEKIFIRGFVERQEAGNTA